MIRYVNASNQRKRFCGIVIDPGESKEFPVALNDPGMLRVAEVRPEPPKAVPAEIKPIAASTSSVQKTSEPVKLSRGRPKIIKNTEPDPVPEKPQEEKQDG